MRSLLLIAWQYVVCRTVAEFRLYIRMRFGSLLDADIRALPHVAILVATPFCATIHAHLHSGSDDPELIPLRNLLVEDLKALEFPEHQPLFTWASNTFLHQWGSDTGPVDRKLFQLSYNQAESGHELIEVPQNLSAVHLTVIEGLPHGEKYDGSASYPFINRLTVIAPRGESSNWGRQLPLFSFAYPQLHTLTLMGVPTRMTTLLPYLPQCLQRLVLDIEDGLPGAPDGIIHFWSLIPVLRQGLKVGGGETSPRLTLITGPNEPVGWHDAVRIAGGTGVRLDRVVESDSARRGRRWFGP
jgi:hypothetical protein